MKIVINRCFGGFSLSDEAYEEYAKLKGIQIYKSREKFCGSHTFYLVPEDECHQIYEADKKIKNYKRSNELVLSNRDIERTDPFLIAVVESLKEKANGMCAKLGVVEIPDDIEWEITEYDGYEKVEEIHRSWS